VRKCERKKLGGEKEVFVWKAGIGNLRGEELAAVSWGTDNRRFFVQDEFLIQSRSSS